MYPNKFTLIKGNNWILPHLCTLSIYMNIYVMQILLNKDRVILYVYR